MLDKIFEAKPFSTTLYGKRLSADSTQNEMVINQTNGYRLLPSACERGVVS